MNTNHTPGPWAVGYANPTDGDTSTLAVWTEKELEAGFGTVICKVSPEQTMNDTDVANAKLIAAAPDLLNAALKISDACNKYNIEVLSPEYELLIEAIRKAQNP